ncbi:hypothetical protein AURDEDRAFT_126215 [Auricularia subglabra TFB-10046 SS5]|nr:hypothetical protein AURDEDRAFT_126215 [Auricularia subglabra TFB-10046 SS5]
MLSTPSPQRKLGVASQSVAATLKVQSTTAAVTGPPSTLSDSTSSLFTVRETFFDCFVSDTSFTQNDAASPSSSPAATSPASHKSTLHSSSADALVKQLFAAAVNYDWSVFAQFTAEERAFIEGESADACVAVNKAVIAAVQAHAAAAKDREATAAVYRIVAEKLVQALSDRVEELTMLKETQKREVRVSGFRAHFTNLTAAYDREEAEAHEKANNSRDQTIKELNEAVAREKKLVQERETRISALQQAQKKQAETEKELPEQRHEAEKSRKEAEGKLEQKNKRHGKEVEDLRAKYRKLRSYSVQAVAECPEV